MLTLCISPLFSSKLSSAEIWQAYQVAFLLRRKLLWHAPLRISCS